MEKKPILQAGSAVDSYCTKCKIDMGHTIIAMLNNAPKRVTCNTCKSQHNYRPVKGISDKTTKKTTPKKRKTASSKTIKILDYASLLDGRNPDKGKQYSMNETFEQNEILMHNLFGSGIVLQVRDNKIDVLFENSKKMLMHNKQN